MIIRGFQAGRPGAIAQNSSAPDDREPDAASPRLRIRSVKNTRFSTSRPWHSRHFLIGITAASGVPAAIQGGRNRGVLPQMRRRDQGRNAIYSAFRRRSMPRDWANRCECCGKYGFETHRHHPQGRASDSDWFNVCNGCCHLQRRCTCDGIEACDFRARFLWAC